MTLTDYHGPTEPPGHATGNGPLGLVYDPSCPLCREVTAQPPPGVLPGWLEQGLDQVAGTEVGS